MKVTPTQLALACLGLFATVIGISVLANYTSNKEFKNSLPEIIPDVASLRNRVVAEENMTESENTIDEIE